MRRRRLGTADESSEVNLTPMLDVVFIMLIFFIVTTSFIKESGVEIERPESSAASPRPDAQVLVAITPEGPSGSTASPWTSIASGQRWPTWSATRDRW